jgi:hypothetical protein
LGCILFSGAAKALKSRDQWIGWSTNERLRNQGCGARLAAAMGISSGFTRDLC